MLCTLFTRLRNSLERSYEVHSESTLTVQELFVHCRFWIDGFNMQIFHKLLQYRLFTVSKNQC